MGGGNGAAHDPSRAKGVEDGGGADSHAEQAGLEGAEAGGLAGGERRVHPGGCRRRAVQSEDAKGASKATRGARLPRRALR